MKRLIVYDLDGTLVDTLGDIAAAANHLLRQSGSPELPAQEIRRYIGRGVRELVRGCLKSDDSARLERGVEIYRAYYAAHLVDRSRLYPGALAVLTHFSARRQAVITNKPDVFSRDILRALGIEEFFCQIVGGDSGYPKKPDPASIRAVMEASGALPAETLFIGDSPIDIETGRNAGVLTVGVTHGFSDEDELRRATPDEIVRDFEALRALAKREQW